MSEGEFIRAYKVVVDKYAGYCAYCFTRCFRRYDLRYHSRYLTIDHRIPRSLGGGDGVNNLVVACRRCNIQKSARDYREFSKFMKQSIFKKNITLKLRRKAVQLYKRGLSTRQVAVVVGKSHQWVSRVVRQDIPKAFK